MSRRLLLIPIILFFILVAIVWPGLSSTLTDWWWFKEIGYQVIFTKEITTRGLLFLGVFGVATALFYGNFRFAQRGLAMVPFSVQLGPGLPPLNFSSALRRLSLPIALVLGFLFGSAGSTAWETILLAMDRTPFGTLDPVFGRDISYYVFTLPAIDGILTMLTVLAFFALVLLLPTYFLRGDIVVAPPKNVTMAHAASRHVGIILALYFVLIALELWFVDIPSLLFSTSGPQMVGASYTDLHATLPALRLSAIVALVAAVAVAVGGSRGHLTKYGLRAVVAYALVGIVGRGIYPALMQKFFVAPTELTRETPYLKYHLAATRQAWGLDSVEIKELGDAGNLTLTDIRNNGPTIDNIRLWDRDPLLQTFGQLQEIRTYYDFLNVDDDRYWIDGKYRQVLLSPRELNAASLPQRTFINEHLTYTHGMGLTLGPVNQVTSEGLPVLFVKDLPPVSSISIKVTRPQIYYGEIGYDYAVVNTREKEFDHPSGDENVYASYTGTGGVSVRNTLRRLVMATTFGEMKILLSGDINGNSKVLYYRNIRQRVEKALPFLKFDRDPYMVVAEDGTLKWIMDGYTSSDRYPYSHRVSDGTSYMRNSVKVVLDAYDGSIRAFVSAPNDPLIRTWGRIFPGILLPLDSMPTDLRKHIRYPDDLFRLQTALYATYHLDSAATFYLREDQWAVPGAGTTDTSVPFMRHIVMRLPGEKDAEFVYMVPFTPRGKDNLAAWMVARNDGAEYGKLRVYKLSRTSLVFGPTQIENRINQNTQISQQVSLWDQRGSKVLRGDLLVIPIEGSLLYVQPLYLQAEGGKIPELKRVVIAYQNQVVMQETLEGGLNELFGGSTQGRATPTVAGAAAAAPTAADAAANVQSLIAEARQRYDNSLQAQREGDWARYGAEIKALGQVLERLKAGQAKRP